MGVSRTGPRFPAKNEDCQVEYRYDDFTNVMMTMQKNGYVQVASATLVNAGTTLNEDMKKRLNGEACKAGGDLVIMTSSDERGELPGSGIASFVILRRVGLSGGAPSAEARESGADL